MLLYAVSLLERGKLYGNTRCIRRDYAMVPDILGEVIGSVLFPGCRFAWSFDGRVNPRDLPDWMVSDINWSTDALARQTGRVKNRAAVVP